MKWKVVIIGTGNVAKVLGKKIKNCGHSVIQVAGRQADSVKKLATALQSNYIVGFDGIVTGADIYIVAVSDEALYQVGTWLKLKERLVVHTAGSMSADILKEIGLSYGTLYPFQSLRSDRYEIPEIPFLVNANDETARIQLANFASTLSKKVQIVDDATRTKLHIAAVIANNFSNHLFTLAQDFCNKEGLDFTILQPLLNETVNRLQQCQAEDMQTGPAVRGDKIVIQKHISTLEQYPYHSEIYQQMTKSIQNWYQTNETKP